MKLTTRETATVLAALRYWQQDLAENNEPPISDHFAEVKPLSVLQIDKLCERINLHDVDVRDDPMAYAAERQVFAAEERAREDSHGTHCPDCGKALRQTTTPEITVTYGTTAVELWCADCEKLWIQEYGDNAQGLYAAEEQPEPDEVELLAEVATSWNTAAIKYRGMFANLNNVD